MKLSEKQKGKLILAEKKAKQIVDKSIVERGLFVERSMPIYGKHYHKYIVFLKNGQEVNFRDYYMDDSSISEYMPNIIQTIVGNVDKLTPYIKGKFSFFKGEFINRDTIPDDECSALQTINFRMSYFQPVDAEIYNESFRNKVKDNPLLTRLVDDPRIAQLGNLFFSYNEGNIYVLHVFGLTPEALMAWHICTADKNLHYYLMMYDRYLEHAGGYTWFSLKPLKTAKSVDRFIDTLVTVIEAEEQLKKQYPGNGFLPQIFFKFQKSKTKLKNQRG